VFKILTIQRTLIEKKKTTLSQFFTIRIDHKMDNDIYLTINALLIMLLCFWELSFPGTPGVYTLHIKVAYNAIQLKVDRQGILVKIVMSSYMAWCLLLAFLLMIL